MPSLVLKNATRTFGDVQAVAPVSLTLQPGSFTALVGPSGCGKTTLLRLMGGLEQLDGGELLRAEGAISFCFQEPRLLPWRSVLDNVALPLELQGIPRAIRVGRAREALIRVQLDDAETRFPNELSGGMKMRAAIARALVASPSLLLLDEPFGALDEVTRQDLDAELRALWERERFTAVVVTHSLPEAVYLAERVVVFSPRPARIVADLSTPQAKRNLAFWTSPWLYASAREASEALHGAIAEARR